MIRAGLLLAVLAGALPAAAETVEALVEERARASFGARFPETGVLRVAVSHAPVKEAELLSAFWMDEATGQFIANAVDENGRTHRLNGYAILRVPVPVPARRMMPGEVVTGADLIEIELPQGRLGSFAVADRAKLIGMEVKSILPQGRPVMAQSVMEPLVIARGQSVTIRYDDGQLALTAPGRALRDAHAGQDVKVVNVASNTTIVGRAAADGSVEVIR